MGLGRNEKLHLSCKYKGRENDCPKECSKCAISIKTDGDIALVASNVDSAIRQYKKALFIEPRFAEAWCNLANAYGMKSEYNNSITAFNKALAIDPQYGKALFGKAVSLRNLGKMNEAMALANEILELYDDEYVKNFKAELKKAGVRNPSATYTLQRAIKEMTDKAFEIITNNHLLDKDGQIHTIQAIDRKEDFTSKIYSFCKRRYGTLGNEKVWSESILAAFYGSAFITLKYYQIPDVLSGTDPFEYLCNNVDLEELDRNTEKLLGIRGDDNQSEKIWNIIYPFVTFSTSVLAEIDPPSDLDAAVRDAAESAYIMGMLLAMRHQDQKEMKAKRLELDSALRKLAESAKDYTYTPVPSAMCYSTVPPDEVPLYFTCDGCSQKTNIHVYEANGTENQMIAKYKELANEFTKLGFPATVKCYCDNCANRLFPPPGGASVDYSVLASKMPSLAHLINHSPANNIVFSVKRPDRNEPVNSFPYKRRYSDFDYQIALAFLRGADTITKLSKATDSNLQAETYLKSIHEVLGDVTMGVNSK